MDSLLLPLMEIVEIAGFKSDSTLSTLLEDLGYCEKKKSFQFLGREYDLERLFQMLCSRLKELWIEKGHEVKSKVHAMASNIPKRRAKRFKKSEVPSPQQAQIQQQQQQPQQFSTTPQTVSYPVVTHLGHVHSPHHKVPCSVPSNMFPAMIPQQFVLQQQCYQPVTASQQQDLMMQQMINYQQQLQLLQQQQPTSISMPMPVQQQQMQVQLQQTSMSPPTSAQPNHHQQQQLDEYMSAWRQQPQPQIFPQEKKSQVMLRPDLYMQHRALLREKLEKEIQWEQMMQQTRGQQEQLAYNSHQPFPVNF